MNDVAFFANGQVSWDAGAGVWCLQQDRRLAFFLVAYAIAGGAVFWLVPAPVQYGIHVGILALALGTTALFTKNENRSFTLGIEDAGLRLGDRTVPWSSLRAVTVEKAEIRTVLGERGGELGALVLDIDGTREPYLTRAPIEALERLAEALRERI
ncbi:MAG: hypothetical protein H6737_08880 [Alphaproteobacteria bacterium]|nr:hypothetical protein [Alphaproteobacteria bacterium]